MMLRASSDKDAPQLEHVMPESEGSIGVQHEAVLIRIAETTIGRNPEAGKDVFRDAVDVLGTEGAVDAVATAAHFDAITRIADATGAQLDRQLSETTEGMRNALGIDRFNTTL